MAKRVSRHLSRVVSSHGAGLFPRTGQGQISPFSHRGRHYGRLAVGKGILEALCVAAVGFVEDNL